MKINLVMQTKQNECGLCSIAMLASYYGYRRNIEYYRNLFDIGRDGMSAKSICEILEKIHLVPRLEESNRTILHNIKENIPCIVYYQSHYVVLEKIKRGYCYICDPAAGYVKCTLEELSKKEDIYIISVKKAPEFKKVNEKKFVYSNILKMMHGIVLILAFTALLSVVVNILNIMIPQMMQNIIDSIIEGDIEKYKNRILIKMLLISALYLLFTKLRNDKLVELQGKVLEEVSSKTMKHLLKISYKFYDNRSTGDILYRINVLSEVEKQVSGIIISLVIAVTSIVVLFAFICSMANLYLILIMIAIIIILSGFVFRQNKILLEYNRKMVSENQNLNVIQTEIISQIYQIKTMKYEKYFLNLFNEKNKDYIDKYERNQKGLSDFSMFIGLFEMFVPLVVILCMTVGKLGTDISIGTLFTLYVVIQLYIKYVISLANTCVQVYSMKNSLHYINDILDEKEENVGKIIVQDFQKLCFVDVSFRYNESQNNILNKVNFEVLAGQKVSIVGSSGTGKSTIIKLLARLYKVSGGSIQFNGRYNISEINEDSYSKMIGIVSQQTIMFNKTIRENLVLYDDKISEEDIIESLKLVNMWDDVREMPMKLDTSISSESKNLSGGQIQKLSIARAILRKPKLLILDESTSSLDAFSELVIHSNLKKIGVTLIVISHRLSTIQDADCIYVLQNGCIEAKGKHSDLMKNNSFYHELYVKQCIDSDEFVEKEYTDHSISS